MLKKIRENVGVDKKKCADIIYEWSHSPPNHEPGKMKQAYRSLKNKFKKSSDKYKAPPEPGS